MGMEKHRYVSFYARASRNGNYKEEPKENFRTEKYNKIQELPGGAQ